MISIISSPFPLSSDYLLTLFRLCADEAEGAGSLQRGIVSHLDAKQAPNKKLTTTCLLQDCPVAQCVSARCRNLHPQNHDGRAAHAAW